MFSFEMLLYGGVEVMASLKAVFIEADVSGDGELDREEMRLMLKKSYVRECRAVRCIAEQYLPTTLSSFGCSWNLLLTSFI